MGTGPALDLGDAAGLAGVADTLPGYGPGGRRRRRVLLHLGRGWGGTLSGSVGIRDIQMQVVAGELTGCR